MTGTDPDDAQGRMPLGQHLDELRRCLLRGGLVFVTLFLLGASFDDPLIRFMVEPWNWARESVAAHGGLDPGPLGMIKPTEGVIFTLKVALWFATLVGGPFYLWQLWSFIAVGLHGHERRAVYSVLPASLGLFVVGLWFGYRVMVPFTLPILLTWVPEDLARPTVTLSEYFGTLSSLTLLMGFVFQLPLAMWLVVRTGLVDAAWLGQSRRVAIVIILIFAAVMTPPDVITQIFVAIPMVLLYEAGLLLARRAQAARERESL